MSRMSRDIIGRFPRAFTLAEMLVTVVCISIAGTLVIPNMGNTDGSKLSAAASLLASDLEFVQSESMAHGDDPRVIVFDTTAGTWRMAAKSAPTTTLNHPVTSMPWITQLEHGRAASLKGVTIQSVSFNGTGELTLGFGPQGDLDQTSNATITLGCGRKRVTLTINAVSGATTISAIQ
jgi:Tfp pilus assembly protein FimT